MVNVLATKPGINGANTLSIPKTWDATWFRSFIANSLKGADVRNAVGTNGVTVSGTIASPYATISLGAGPITIPAPASGTTLTVNAPANGTAVATTNSGANPYNVLTWSNSNGSGQIDITAAGTTEIGTIGNNNLDFIVNNLTVVQITPAGAVNLRALVANGGALIQGYNTSLSTRTGYLDFVSGTGGVGGATETILDNDGTTANDYLSFASGGSRRIQISGTGGLTINTASATGTATPTLGTNKPGSNSSPATWLVVTIGGATRYIPCWS